MAKIRFTADIEIDGAKTKEDAYDAIIGMLNDYEDMNPGAPTITMYIKPE